MRCPVCQTRSLYRTELEEGPVAGHCPKCGGYFISSADYQQWIDEHGVTPEANEFEEIDVQTDNAHRAVICPDCGHLMTKYHVGHGINFLLDHCGHCNGVWLDDREWAALRMRNLHDEINRMFTTTWQSDVRKETFRELMRQRYEKDFGEDFDEVLRIRRWVVNHPRRHEILAFLNDPHPEVE